jgi:hypothetical protein
MTPILPHRVDRDTDLDSAAAEPVEGDAVLDSDAAAAFIGALEAFGGVMVTAEKADG